MVTNEYPNWLVPLDAAKKLKDLGFNEPCIFSYSEGFGITACLRIGASDEPLISDFIIGGNTPNSPLTDLPTWGQVLKWFRDKKIYGNVNQEWEYGNYNSPRKLTYFYVINDCRKVDIKKTEPALCGGFDSYEEAREYLLNRLIEIYGKSI